jgi:myo-inositol 2-dehydrogenase / D-chiro-inositol 1-dehydrogenase
VENANPPLRLAVVGCGRVVEQCHLPALQTLAGVELVALVDTDLGVLHKIADRLGVRARYGDYRTGLDDARVDVVAVCAPPQFHAEIGLAVLDAGKHLFMEKPLALGLNDADRLVARAVAGPGKAFMAFNLRWHRLVRQARRVIDEGRLGALEMIHTAFTSRTGFRTEASDWRHRRDLGGSVLFDLGIHHFDLWRFLTQSEVEKVFANSSSNGRGIECATVSSTMENGVLVTSTFSHGLSDTNELEICGRRGRLRMSCYRFDSFWVSDNAAPQGALRDWLGRIGRVFRTVPQVASRLRRRGDVADSYRAEWQHFIDAIRSDTPVACTFEDARRAVQIALAAVESASRGQPIRVGHAARVIVPLASPTRMNRTVGERDS